MTLRSSILPLALLLSSFVLRAEKPVRQHQADSLLYSDTFLDTVDVSRKLILNDYSLIGFHYAYGLNRMNFNPVKKQARLHTPLSYGVSYTRYGKMFGFMPYFGLQIGLNYAQDGYRFEPDKETGYTPTVDGATMAVYDIVEAPLLALFHIDMWNFKLFADLGFYGGYRLKVHRDGELADPTYADTFYDYDRRWDYGLKGGGGFGIVFDPFELHFGVQYRYGLSSLYKPDYNSQYFYRFAYPSDIQLTVGLYMQLSKRSGKTRHQLKKDAYNAVYAPKEEEL